MQLPDVLRSLHRLGKEAIRKALRQQGVKEPVHGAAAQDLAALQQQIGIDHALAVELWRTGIHDARVLAAAVADPQRIDAVLLEEWVAAVADRVLLSGFSAAAARSPVAVDCSARWVESGREWVQAAGWWVRADLAKRTALPDSELLAWLPVLERRIDKASAIALDAMRLCILAIGSRRSLRTAALQVARRLGDGVAGGDRADQKPVAVTPVAGQRQEAAVAVRRTGRKAKPAKAAAKPPKKRAKPARAVKKKAARAKPAKRSKAPPKVPRR